MTVTSRVSLNKQKFLSPHANLKKKKKSLYKIDLKHSLTTGKQLQSIRNSSKVSSTVTCAGRAVPAHSKGLNFSCLSSAGCLNISVRCSFSAAAKSWAPVTFLESRLIRGVKGSNRVAVGSLTEAWRRREQGTRAKLEQSATLWERRDFLLPSVECWSHL